MVVCLPATNSRHHKTNYYDTRNTKEPRTNHSQHCRNFSEEARTKIQHLRKSTAAPCMDINQNLKIFRILITYNLIRQFLPKKHKNNRDNIDLRILSTKEFRNDAKTSSITILRDTS